MRTYETLRRQEAAEAGTAAILQPSAEDWKAATMRMLGSQSQSKKEPDQLDLSAPIYPAAHHAEHAHGHHGTANGAHHARHRHEHHSGHMAQHTDSQHQHGPDNHVVSDPQHSGIRKYSK